MTSIPQEFYTVHRTSSKRLTEVRKWVIWTTKEKKNHIYIVGCSHPGQNRLGLILRLDRHPGMQT